MTKQENAVGNIFLLLRGSQNHPAGKRCRTCGKARHVLTLMQMRPEMTVGKVR